MRTPHSGGDAGLDLPCAIPVFDLRVCSFGAVVMLEKHAFATYTDTGDP